MAEIAEAVKVHVFEQAGLGKAPFRYGGCSREVYVACPGAPVQPGGCCDYCGNGIMYEFHLEGADGKRFKVGSECIMKAGDGGLKRVVKEEIARMNRAKAAEKRALDHGWLLNLLSHPEVADVLAAKPHPLDWAKAKGLTLLDWATWMACNGGGSAWAATLKRVRAECGIAKPERRTQSADWVIFSDLESLFWSNELGWATAELATTFSHEETERFNLPVGGRWIRKVRTKPGRRG